MLRRSETRFTRRRKRQARIRRTFALGIVLLLLTGWAAAHEVLEVRQVRINGLMLPADSALDWASRHRNRWESTEMTLMVDGLPYRKTRAELGARLSTEELQEALAYADGDKAGGGADIVWLAEVNHTELLESVFAIRQAVAPAAPDGDSASPRKTLDLHAALKILKKGLPTSVRIVELPMGSVVRWGVGGVARPGSFSKLLARHVSEYRATGRSWSRGYNIEQAAKALDAVVIEPHGELSFNEVVGERSFQRGFMPANEIAGGRVVDGIGGGVCQVATALHAAALQAGFEILEHSVHSKRPRYAGRGIDSAVAWGLKDLRIRNPFPDYVRIRGDARAGTLTIGLWSGREPPEVEIATEVRQGSIDARDQRLVVLRTRTIHWPGGPTTETTLLNYPAEPKD